MTPPVWVAREAVLAVHEQMLAEFGGDTGVRDAGLVESSLARPENKFAYEAPMIFEMAAAYAYGIVRNHPFVDGNKRTGFMAAVMFLERNGYRFRAGEADAVVRTLGLAAGDVAEADYAAWLAENGTP